MPELLKQKRDAGFKAERFFGDSEEDLHEIDALCSEIFGRNHVVFQVGEPGQLVHARALLPLSSTNFRAIAKIGFHAFLFFYPNVTGFEPEFDAIKRFIYKGEEANTYVPPVPIVRTVDLSAPAHAVVCDWSQHTLETRLQLFAGLEKSMRVVGTMQGKSQFTAPQGEPVYVVSLGPNPSRLLFEDRRGAVLNYFNAPESGYHGKMTDLRGFGKVLPIAALTRPQAQP